MEGTVTENSMPLSQQQEHWGPWAVGRAAGGSRQPQQPRFWLCPHLVILIAEAVAVHEAAALGRVAVQVHVVGQAAVPGCNGLWGLSSFGDRGWGRPPRPLLTVLAGVARWEDPGGSV